MPESIPLTVWREIPHNALVLDGEQAAAVLFCPKFTELQHSKKPVFFFKE